MDKFKFTKSGMFRSDEGHYHAVTDVDAHVAEKVARYTLRISDLEYRIAELEKYEHLCRLALASLDQGQSVQFGSAWHEQLRSLMVR